MGRKMNDNEQATEKQIKKIYAVLHSLNIKSKDFKDSQKIESIEKLTRRQASDWIEELERQEQEGKQKENISPGSPKKREELITIMQESLKDAEEILNEYVETEEAYITDVSTVRAQIAIVLFNQRLKD